MNQSDSRLTASLRDAIGLMQELGIDRPTYVMLSSKYAALKLIKQVCPGGNSLYSGSSAAAGIEAGTIHSFMLFGIEFCWPADPPLDNVLELKEVA